MQLPVQKSARNRSCGDAVTLGIEYDPSTHRVTTIVHHADGCMLCRASASILCLVVEGRTQDEILALKRYVDAVCSIDNLDQTPVVPDFLSSEMAQQFEALLEIRKYPTRFKCVKLAWDAISSK
jgi:nitrogen fixation NifU-like protein